MSIEDKCGWIGGVSGGVWGWRSNVVWQNDEKPKLACLISFGARQQKEHLSKLIFNRLIYVQDFKVLSQYSHLCAKAYVRCWCV